MLNYNNRRKTMRSKTVQFTCEECKQDVYRLGKKVNLSLKICGKCNNSRPLPASQVAPKVRESVKVAENVAEIAEQSASVSSDVKAALVQYRNILDRVEKLMVEYPQATFIELWEKAKH
jgi:transcription elongation factor Elf1